MSRKSPLDQATEYYLKLAYSRHQAASLAWAEYFVMDEAKKILRGEPAKTRVDCHCWDCNIGKILDPKSAYVFIRDHKGHRTASRKL